MIEVDEQFEVAAAPQTVWQVLADPYAVVGCMPGAAIVGEAEDGSLETTLGVKFGPMNVTFRAQAKLELDAASMRGRLTARGKDKQGGARFESRATFSVNVSNSGSEVKVRGEVDLSGPLASMIEAGATVIVRRMSADFSTCLRARCALPVTE